jgi:uncharacterized membrane protein
MKKIIVILAMNLGCALLANTAHADTFSCYQTEPFFTEVFNTDNGTAVITDSVMKKSKKLSGLKLIIKDAGKFEIRDASGKVIREMILNNQGTDGMSDKIYPFSATDNHGLWGAGCESTELKGRE